MEVAEDTAASEDEDEDDDHCRVMDMFDQRVLEHVSYFHNPAGLGARVCIKKWARR